MVDPIARGVLNRNFRVDFRIDEVNEADMAWVKRDVKVDDEEGVIEGAYDSRKRCEASSEQFSEFELSPVEPVEPYSFIFSLLLITDDELDRTSSPSYRDIASLISCVQSVSRHF